MSWLFSNTLVDCFENSLSSQVLVAAYSAANCSDGTPSVPLSTSSTPPAYLYNDKTTGSFRLSRFGMTYEPLTESRGEELLTWFREVFLAKTSPLPAPTVGIKAKDLMETSQGCGPSSGVSLAKLHPGGYWLKTPLTSEPKVLNEFSKTWPASGTMLRGECFRQKTLEPITNGSGCGLLPTPTTMGNQLCDSMMKHKGCRNLKDFLRKLPTPTAHNAKEGGYPAEGTRKTPTLGWEVGGKIPPILTEWMMGWPVGWTDLKPLETGKFLSWQQQHSANCNDAS